MTLENLSVLALGVALAFVNGGNDVSKGIATLVGSGVTDYRRAIVWGAAWSSVGALLAGFAAHAMLATFGKGLLDASVTPSFAAALATIFGASAWVLLATRFGLPVSTTHAIVGAVVGVSAVAYGTAAVQWLALTTKIAIPLLLSPLAAYVCTRAVLYAARGTNAVHDDVAANAPCLCVTAAPAQVVPVSSGLALHAAVGTQLAVHTGTAAECARTPAVAVRLGLEHAHWLSSGATSFARGMNDAPKIVALVFAASAVGGAQPLSAPLLFGMVTVAMLGGSLYAGERVTRVLAENVTALDARQGLGANAVTASLVIAGAVFGLPMSTTQVSSSGIVGAASTPGALNRKTVRDIALAWAVTLPAAAALGIGSYAAAHAFGW